MKTPAPASFHESPASRISVFRVVLKALLLFLLCNVVFLIATPLSTLGRLSAYNWLYPGRQRLPYGDNPAKAYNLTLNNLEAMFASHELAGSPKADDEFRVIVIGDSATWGYLLENKDTLTGALNSTRLVLPDGRKVAAYNLGYPVMSLTKDLLLLSIARRYEPDLIIWPMTLESFPKDKQLFPPLLQNNPQATADLLNRAQIEVDTGPLVENKPGLFNKTIWGARRELADLLRLQLYGILWAATRIDQDIPDDFIPRQADLPDDSSFHGWSTAPLDRNNLAIDVLQAGRKLTEDIPILYVNEPMFISQGENSDIRYNFYYPRWAYDEYRQLMDELCRRNGWDCLDLWDAVPASEFTNTAIHMTPAGVRIMANKLLPAISSIAGRTQTQP